MGEIIKTKEEYIAFISHLMNAADVTIDHKRVFMGLSRGVRDIADIIVPILNRIKNYQDAQDAYQKIGNESYSFHGSKEQRKQFPFIYREELYNYLLSLGINEEHAQNYTDIIGCGMYKAECVQHKKNWSLEKYGEIHNWAKAVHFMTSWDRLPGLFASEYKKFAQQK